jgi:hypothetical protein
MEQTSYCVGCTKLLKAPSANLNPALSLVAMCGKVLYIVATVFTRLGLLTFYWRLVHDTGFTVFKYLIWACVVLNIGILIAFFYLSVWLCRPASDYWKFGGNCLNEGNVVLAGGVASTFADVLITALPIPLVMNVQMPALQRGIVIFLLSLGFSVVVAGAIR